jgi:hypothetical protein
MALLRVCGMFGGPLAATSHIRSHSLILILYVILYT